MHFVLDEDLSARDLKSIIKQCDFFIGQRRHSLIGTVSAETPFVALTGSGDRGTHDIISEMCGFKDQMIDMDKFSPSQAAAEILEQVENLIIKK